LVKKRRTREVRFSRVATVTGCSCRSHGTFLTAKGLEEAAQRRRFLGVDTPVGECELDRVVSVSGLEPLEIIFDDALIEQQHRRFLNGT